MRSINNSEQYNQDFSKKKSFIQIETVREKALLHALDIRKFEIDLYWKRATYFWAFIAATFAGYVAMKTSTNKPPIETFVLIECLGLGFSVSWYFVNRGSKFWQNNWERHVDMLEDEIIGPLYKTAIDIRTCYFRRLHKEYPFSVSRINQMLSLYIVSVWIFLIAQSVSETYDLNQPFKGFNSILTVAATITFFVCMMIFGKTEQKATPGTYTRDEKRLIVRDSYFEDK